MLRNNRLSLQFFATTRQLGQMAILGIQFSSLYALWFTGCSTNVSETTNNMKLINNTSIEQQTIQQFEKVIEINPNNIEVHNNLGLAYYNQGKYSQAVTEFEKVIRINPNNIEAHNGLGLVCYSQGKYQQAEVEFEKVIKLDPNNAIAHHNLGLVYKEQGKIAEAEIEFKEAKDILAEE